MAPTQWASPFPSLKLTAEDKAELLRTTSSVLKELIEDYSKYLKPTLQTPDSAEWTPIREREALCVYQNKRQGGGTANKNLHLLMTTGTVVGSFNDVMYGMLNHTTEYMRIRSANINDTLTNGAVLDTVLSPTEEQPFQSVTIRWRVKALPLYLRALTRNRDAVFLEATNTCALPNGEVIGYQIKHSVDFPTTSPLPQLDRVSVSSCTLWKAVGQDHVSVMTRFFCLFGERTMGSMTLRSFADAMLALWKSIHWAQLKKLAWLVQNPKAVQRDHRARDEGGTCCVVCGDPLGEARRTLRHACAVCTKPTCRKCRIMHDILYIDRNARLVEQRTRFCVACVSMANQLDAAIIARQEAMSGLETALCTPRPSYSSGRTHSVDSSSIP